MEGLVVGSDSGLQIYRLYAAASQAENERQGWPAEHFDCPAEEQRLSFGALLLHVVTEEEVKE